MDKLAGVEKTLSHILHVIEVDSSLFFLIGGDSSAALVSWVGVGVLTSREAGSSGRLIGNWSGGVITGNCNVWLLWLGDDTWDIWVGCIDSDGIDRVGDVGVMRSGVGGALVTRGSTPSSTADWSCRECILSCFFQLLASLNAFPHTLQPYGFSPVNSTGMNIIFMDFINTCKSLINQVYSGLAKPGYALSGSTLHVIQCSQTSVARTLWDHEYLFETAVVRATEGYY